MDGVIRFRCKTHDVTLVWDAEKKIKRLEWEYGKNIRCILHTARIEDLKEGKFRDCEVEKL